MFVSDANEAALDRPETLLRLESILLARHRGVILELSIQVEDGMVVLHGRATSYYGKQLVQEAVMKCTDFGIRANRITVDQYTSPAH